MLRWQTTIAMAACSSVWAALGPSRAEARFLTEDAEQIDPEELLSTETWNDRLSYRYPVYWDSLWDAADTAFRVNAGSLNVNRFDYAEDLKLSVGRRSDA